MNRSNSGGSGICPPSSNAVLEALRPSRAGASTPQNRPSALNALFNPLRKERSCSSTPTVDTMTAMHLTAMADAFQRQLASPQFADLSFEERVGMLWT